MKKAKRLRAPIIKEGELRMYWGRERRGEQPQVMFGYCGDAAMRRDMNMLVYRLSGKQRTTDFYKGSTTFEPSVLEELENRGYDLTTLKFSIRKKGGA